MYNYIGENAVKINLDTNSNFCPGQELIIWEDQYEFFQMGTELNITKTKCEFLCLQKGDHACNFVKYEKENETCTWGKVIFAMQCNQKTLELVFIFV